MSKFYFYMNGPIDFGWANHPSIQEVESRFTDEGEDDPCSLSEWRELLCCLETAKVFKNKSKYNQGIYSWFEGKFADGPVVCFVPGTDLYFSAILVWKQHNNGSVFTLSPIPLPYLIENCVDHAVFEVSEQIVTNREYKVKLESVGK